MRDLAHEYINGILDGTLNVPITIRQAVDRHLSDLEKSKSDDFEYYFSEDAADHFFDFLSLCRHTKGSAAGKPFNVQAWQAFLCYLLFGWLRKDNDLRRFTKSYLEIPRKNGKTELFAVVAAYCLLFDGEEGAEVYLAATKRDQAKICFTAARKIVKMLRQDSVLIKKLATVYMHNVHVDSTDSKMEAVSSDHDTMDGPSPSCAIIDEYHAHKDNELVKVIETGMGARDQPLLSFTTTAGKNINSPCYKFHKVCKQVLDGVIINDRLLVIMYTPDEDDDWEEMITWEKLNPNLGVSITMDFFKSQYTSATTEGYSAKSNFKTKNLNFWLKAGRTWIEDKLWWNAGHKIDFETLRGKRCFGGLDLSSVRDLTSYALYFPDFNYVLWYLWLPEETAEERSGLDGVNYLEWGEQGWITLTSGNVIDYEYVEKTIKESCDDFDVISIGYDDWNSTQIVLNLLKEEIPLNKFGQGYKSMNTPTKHLEKMAAEQSLNHGNNPVARWAMSNVAIKEDPAGNIKVDKDKSSDKVDPIVSMVMAIGESITTEEEGESYYENNEVISIG